MDLSDDATGTLFCRVSPDDILSILPAEAIPALTNPTLVGADHPDAAYVSDRDRVIGLLIGDEAVAFPLNLMAWHENVNVDIDGQKLAVSYCPLTGTTLAFDRSVVGGAELGVSGLLFRNNLVLFDRGAEARSLFPQMLRSAQCGPLARTGLTLPMHPAWEMTWAAWRALFSDTRVVSERTGFDRPYDTNPNSEYERVDNAGVLFPIDMDPRRPPKERVLGIPVGGDGGPAFPFGVLDEVARRAISVGVGPSEVVVFWDRAARAALPFSPVVEGRTLSFVTTPEGYVDQETGSSWRLDGLAVSGALAGHRLRPIAEAYVAFWFAWADFHPQTWVWR